MDGPLKYQSSAALSQSTDPVARRIAAAVRRAHEDPRGALAERALQVEAERQRLLADDGEFELLAPGRGRDGLQPQNLRRLQKTVSDVTGRISSSPRRARLLYTLLAEFQPEVALEMGTGVGISTGYQAAAVADNGYGRLVCLEGAPGLAAIASGVVDRMGLAEQVDIRVGWFDRTLPAVLELPIGYAYVDGHHEEEPTLRYHELLVRHARAGAVLVYDDIRWSDGMLRAWEVIADDERVALSVDLRWRGVVVTR